MRKKNQMGGVWGKLFQTALGQHRKTRAIFFLSFLLLLLCGYSTGNDVLKN